MVLRRRYALALVAVFLVGGASYRTTNFVVEAPTPQVAEQIGQAAEHYRKEKAVLWLGQEMPTWPEPCPLRVKVAVSGAGGATSFAFHGGQILGQNMNIEGPLDRLLASVLPHEVTHTVFAHHFRQPVPRWADEGGSVLSEDDAERNRHDLLCRQILNSPGRAIPLRRLFALKEYPADVMALYAQGYSVSNWLVSLGGRGNFLNFVGQGMHPQVGWDQAAMNYFRFRSVEELEQAWLQHLRNTKRPPTTLAMNGAPPRPEGELTNRVVVRQTAPPVQPQLDAPVAAFRGQTEGMTYEGERFGDLRNPVMQPLRIPAQDGWQPHVPEPPAPRVQLGTPQFEAPRVSAPPPQSSPVGFPR